MVDSAQLRHTRLKPERLDQGWHFNFDRIEVRVHLDANRGQNPQASQLEMEQSGQRSGDREGSPSGGREGFPRPMPPGASRVAFTLCQTQRSASYMLSSPSVRVWRAVCVHVPTVASLLPDEQVLQVLVQFIKGFCILCMVSDF